MGRAQAAYVKYKTLRMELRQKKRSRGIELKPKQPWKKKFKVTKWAAKITTDKKRRANGAKEHPVIPAATKEKWQEGKLIEKCGRRIDRY